MTKSIITSFLLIILIISCSKKRDERTYDPQAVELNNKALELMNQDLLDSALLVYDHSIKIDKTYFFPHIGKSIIYMRKKDFNKAFEETQQAIKKKPYAEGYQTLGLIADAKGDSIEAKKYYNKAIKKFDEIIKNSNDSNALRTSRFNKIMTLILIDETQKAENEIEEFKRANPNDGLLESINTLSRDSILYWIKNL